MNKNRRNFLLPLLALPLVPAAALARDDEGEFQILSARYGTPESNVDVTPRLKELAQRDRRFRLENDVFQVDPAFGRPKVLRIFAKGRDGQRRHFEYAEHSWVDGRQFTGWSRGNWGDPEWRGGWDGRERGDRDEGEFLILRAYYGTPRANVDVTPRLSELARRDQRFRLENDIFQTDPAYGQSKVLRIFARGRDGQVRSFDYAEHAFVDGRQFTGWGRGDFRNGDWNGGWDGRPPQPQQEGGGGRLEIISATYGSRNRNIDVTDRIRDLARNGRLELEVSNELFGRDPAYQERKSLRIVYRTERGRDRQIEINEGDRLRLP